MEHSTPGCSISCGYTLSLWLYHEAEDHFVYKKGKRSFDYSKVACLFLLPARVILAHLSLRALLPEYFRSHQSLKKMEVFKNIGELKK
jgi:hypothetical protein